MLGSARFRRAERLRSPRDFQRLAANGQRTDSRNFVVLVARGEDGDQPRLGITASRRVGGAVERNRVKRAIREWFRHDKNRLGVVDVVVIARRPAVGLDSVQMVAELSRLTAEASS